MDFDAVAVAPPLMDDDRVARDDEPAAEVAPCPSVFGARGHRTRTQRVKLSEVMHNAKRLKRAEASANKLSGIVDTIAPHVVATPSAITAISSLASSSIRPRHTAKSRLPMGAVARASSIAFSAIPSVGAIAKMWRRPKTEVLRTIHCVAYSLWTMQLLLLDIIAQTFKVVAEAASFHNNKISYGIDHATLDETKHYVSTRPPSRIGVAC